MHRFNRLIFTCIINRSGNIESIITLLQLTDYLVKVKYVVSSATLIEY